MLLASHDRFDEMAVFNLSDGRLTILSRDEARASGMSDVAGFFSALDGHTWIFFRDSAGTLFLKVDDVLLPLDEETHAKHVRGGSRCSLDVIRNGAVIQRFMYEIEPLDPPLELDPTPFVEEEDFDFGLFVANVCGSTERKEAIFT